MPRVDQVKPGSTRPSQRYTRVEPARARPTHAVRPWGALGAVVLIVVVECLLARHPLHLADPVSLSWRHAASLAANPNAKQILAGDSLIMHGVVPALMREQTGLETVNLGAARAPALFTYFLVRRVLESGVKPFSIVFCAKPAVLMGGPDYDARYWQEVLSPRELLDLAAMTGRGGLWLRLAAGRLIPSLRSRLEVRSWIIATLGGETNPISATNRVLWRNWSVNQGANLASAQSPFDGRLDAQVADRLHTDRFHVDRTNALAIDRMLSLAAREHVLIYWLLPPISPALQARRDQSGAEGEFEAFIQANLARHPNAVVLDARRSGFTNALFCDPTHLNVRGAVILTDLVTRALTSSAHEPRWLPLESLKEPLPPEPAGLEDVEESKAIVNAVPAPPQQTSEAIARPGG